MAKGVSSYIKPKKITTRELDEAGDVGAPAPAPQQQKQKAQAPPPPPEKKWWER